MSERPDDPDLALVQTLLGVWALMTALGVMVLMMPGALPAGISVSFPRALFTAVSVSTLTGFAQSFAQPADFSIVVRVVFVLQTLTGALLALIGGGVLIKRVVESQHTNRAIAICALVLIALSGATGLATIGPGEDAIGAVGRGLGAVAGSGVTFGRVLPASDLTLQLLQLPLAMIGAAGTIVVLDLRDAIFKRRPLSGFSLTVLAILAGGYTIGTAALVLTLNDAGTAHSLMRSGALAIAAQGYGLTGEPISQLRGVQWPLIALMLTGVGTLSTAGGWGLAYFATLPRRLWHVAALGTSCTAIIAIAVCMFLTLTDPRLADGDVLLLTIAALTNTGLSPDPVSIPGNGLHALSLAMLVGRVGPLVLLGLAVGSRIEPLKVLAIQHAEPQPIVDNPSKSDRKVSYKRKAR